MNVQSRSYCHRAALIRFVGSDYRHQPTQQHASVFPKLHVHDDSSRQLDGDDASMLQGSHHRQMGSPNRDSGSTRQTARLGSSHRHVWHCGCGAVFPCLLFFFCRQWNVYVEWSVVEDRLLVRRRNSRRTRRRTERRRGRHSMYAIVSHSHHNTSGCPRYRSRHSVGRRHFHRPRPGSRGTSKGQHRRLGSCPGPYRKIVPDLNLYEDHFEITREE